MHRVIVRVVRLIVVLAVLAAAGVGAWYYLSQQPPPDERLRASGTIEATTVALGPELPGRVAEVLVEEGDQVAAGDPLVHLDAGTLEAQREQAAAGVRAAEAGVAAAEANLALLEAGPSAEQLAVAEGAVERAQVTLDRLEADWDDLTRAQRDTPAGRELRLRRDVASVDLRNAQAQLELTRAGARPEQVEVAEGQLAAAEAQVEAARATLATVETQLGKLTISAPLAGVVLTRAVEPGEYAAPGATLVELGQLDALTITVYVPEDRYGQLQLGQTAEVTVDSFPSEAFGATVVHIADQAEFTPRNVQTPEGRRSTVFAIRLAVADEQGKLKPGMPADVTF